MRIGMVGTRFAGLDGVSLEATKVAEVLRRSGHEVAWFAGEVDDAFSPGVEFPSAHFSDSNELRRQPEYFGTTVRRAGLVDEVRGQADLIRTALMRFVTDLSIDVLMPQNALAIPMQFPLAMAITEVASAGLPVVAHHHDMAWERERFMQTSVSDLLDACFPPRHPGVSHLMINSLAQEQLAWRKGLTSDVLPNVMDFAGEENHQGNATRFRKAANLEPRQIVLLQPTRVIPRKSIETSIDVAQRIDDSVLVITHEEGDEGDAYGRYLRRHAEYAGVDLRFVPVGQDPSLGPTLADAYESAALVLYPSRVEGFGNALLEAFYFRRPVLVRRYPVYQADIAPRGTRCIEIGDHLTDEAVEQARSWIHDPSEWASAVDENYDIGRRHFSLEVAQRVVDTALAGLDVR